MPPTIGQQEMELICFLSDNPEPMTTREVAERFGEPRGLARTTVLTMLERLRKKNLVSREDINGIHHYCARISKDEVLQDAIQSFIDQTLGGSLSPFVAYLTKKAKVNETELSEFIRFIEGLDRDKPNRRGD